MADHQIGRPAPGCRKVTTSTASSCPDQAPCLAAAKAPDTAMQHGRKNNRTTPCARTSDREDGGPFVRRIAPAGSSMIGLVLVTHGRLAVEFRSALEHVVGPQQQIEAVTIGPDDDPEQRRRDIIEAVK